LSPTTPHLHGQYKFELKVSSSLSLILYCYYWLDWYSNILPHLKTIYKSSVMCRHFSINSDTLPFCAHSWYSMEQHIPTTASFQTKEISENGGYERCYHGEAPTSPSPAEWVGEYTLTFISGVFRNAEKLWAENKSINYFNNVWIKESMLFFKY